MAEANDDRRQVVDGLTDRGRKQRTLEKRHECWISNEAHPPLLQRMLDYSRRSAVATIATQSHPDVLRGRQHLQASASCEKITPAQGSPHLKRLGRQRDRSGHSTGRQRVRMGVTLHSQRGRNHPKSSRSMNQQQHDVYMAVGTCVQHDGAR